MPDPNKNNVTFLGNLFPGTVNKSYPQCNYRLRLAGLTKFDPYSGGAPRLSSESDEDYDTRIQFSGRKFGEEEILVNDLVHSSQNIDALEINSEFYDGRVPKTILYIDKCENPQFDESKEEFTYGVPDTYGNIDSVNLNDKDYVKSYPPQVLFPVDLADQEGYMIYRKTTSVNKNGAISENTSGWHPITGFSYSDMAGIVEGGAVVGFTDDNYHLDNDTGVFPWKGYENKEGHWESTHTNDSLVHYTGYEPFTNELFTSYKIIHSWAIEKPPAKENELTRDRKVNLLADPNKCLG